MPDTSPLVRRIGSIFPLTDEERYGLATLPMMVRDHKANTTFVHEGDRPAQCCVLLDGIVCRHRNTRGGQRQILSFHIAGDIPDLQSLHLKVMDHSLGALTPVQGGFIAHEHVHALIRQHPRLASAFWRETLIDGAVFREWIVGLGRRNALQHMAHLFCELYVKMEAVGLAADHAFALPLTQVDLGDALGLSNVHVNRTLQEMRGRNLVALERRVLTIIDWATLKALGEFDPIYLHQDPRGAN